MKIKEYINDIINDFTSDITTVVARTHMKFQILEHVAEAIEVIAEGDNATDALSEYFEDATDIQVTYSTRYHTNLMAKIFVEFSLHETLADETLCINTFTGRISLIGGLEIPLTPEAIYALEAWLNSGNITW